MMNLDGEIQNLHKKIDEQESMLTKLKAEQQKLNNYIKQFKQAMKRKTSMPNEPLKNNVESQKLSAQLEKEIESANSMLKNYQNELKVMQKKSNKVKTDDLTVLEQSLRQKQNQIKKLKDEIKDLQFVKRKQEKMIEKKAKSEDGGKLTRLIEDVRKNKQALETMRAKHRAKEEAIEKKRETLKQLEQKYYKKCEQNGQTPESFEGFKQRRKEKKRDEQSTSKQKIKKVQLGVRDIINSQLSLQNIEYTEKGLKELRGKKEVAQNSLKNAQKKYDKQIEQLNKRLQTLQRENQNLSTRLVEKTKEKEITQINLSDAMKNYSSTRTTRKLTPIK